MQGWAERSSSSTIQASVGWVRSDQFDFSMEGDWKGMTGDQIRWFSVGRRSYAFKLQDFFGA